MKLYKTLEDFWKDVCITGDYNEKHLNEIESLTHEWIKLAWEACEANKNHEIVSRMTSIGGSAAKIKEIITKGVIYRQLSKHPEYDELMKLIAIIERSEK